MMVWICPECRAADPPGVPACRDCGFAYVSGDELAPAIQRERVEYLARVLAAQAQQVDYYAGLEGLRVRAIVGAATHTELLDGIEHLSSIECPFNRYRDLVDRAIPRGIEIEALLFKEGRLTLPENHPYHPEFGKPWARPMKLRGPR
jgi:hypothetical protein